jgi:hypothetical protein
MNLVNEKIKRNPMEGLKHEIWMVDVRDFLLKINEQNPSDARVLIAGFKKQEMKISEQAEKIKELEATITGLQIQHSKGLYTPLHESERLKFREEAYRNGEKVKELQGKLVIAKKALEVIVQHQGIVGGIEFFTLSTTAKIANEAIKEILAKELEGRYFVEEK